MHGLVVLMRGQNTMIRYAADSSTEFSLEDPVLPGSAGGRAELGYFAENVALHPSSLRRNLLLCAP